MALTLTLVKSLKSADAFMDVVSFPGEASYPTGGSEIDVLFNALMNQGRDILAIVPQRGNGYSLEYDEATSKLLMFHGDNNNAAAGPAIEVPNATNLAGSTFKVLVISK
jgi:hypothetical protein